MQDLAKIIVNQEIAKDIWKMELKTDIAKKAMPGQFIEISVPGFFLRRPISINEIKEDSIVIIYKILGEGTKVMTTLCDDLDIFGPLGNGFPIEDEKSVLLIGGGVGVPPLYEVAKRYLAKDSRVVMVMGANDKSSLFYEDEFKALGCEVYCATMDGSYGTKGTALDSIKANHVDIEYVLSCGPLPMLRAVDHVYAKGYISLESRMACGLGACMGCVCKDKEGHSLRVCKDGPVFEIGKVAL